MKDENTTQSPENATKEKFMGFVMDAVKQAMREGMKVDDPRENPVVQGLLAGLGPSAGGVKQAPAHSADSRIGRLVVGGKEYEAWKNRGFKGDSNQVQFAGLGAIKQAAGVIGEDDISSVMSTLRMQEPVLLPFRPLHIIDLFNQVPTNQVGVQFVQQTGFTNAAAPVSRKGSDPALATSSPQSSITTVPKTYAIADIETHIPIPRNMLRDTPAMQNVVERQIIEGLYDAVGAAVLSGNGVAPNMMGILNENIQSRSWSATTEGGVSTDNQADAIGRAIAKLAVAKYPCDAITVSTLLWWTIKLLKDSTGNYLFPQSLTTAGIPTLWGLPVADTAQFPADTALVGSYQRGADYYDRQEGQVQFLEQHSDWATKGLVCAYGTMRGVIVTYRPESFCKVIMDSHPA